MVVTSLKGIEAELEAVIFVVFSDFVVTNVVLGEVADIVVSVK
jgi:hypothetical protein